MAAVHLKDLDRELTSIFAAPDFDMGAETIKSIKKKVIERLGVDTFPKALKEDFKNLLQRLLDENDDSEQEEDENTAPVKRSKSKGKKSTERKGTAARSKKKQKNIETNASVKKASSAYSAKVQSLLDLGQAMRMGPRLHRGLKGMPGDEERIAALTERLEDAGATWKGEVPSPSDVAKAKAERTKQDNLDGIDPSLIIEGGRGRQRGRTNVNYAVDNYASDVYEEGEEEKAVADDESAPPPKRSKGNERHDSSCSDDDDDDDGDFSGSESSDAEAEFD